MLLADRISVKRRAYREKPEDTEGINMAKGKNVNTRKKTVNKDHMGVTSIANQLKDMAGSLERDLRFFHI